MELIFGNESLRGGVRVWREVGDMVASLNAEKFI